jgi:hypothetical protein
MAAKYHAMVNGRIHEIIAQRALKGLEIKNLITFKDKDLEIEKSNASTLKETRYMPADFEFRGMTAIFGDYVTITNLNEDDNFGVIVHDALIARSFESMFDALWGMGTAV